MGTKSWVRTIPAKPEVYAARLAAWERGHAVVRCLSVRLSVRHLRVVETSKHVLKLFHHLVEYKSHQSVFSIRNVMAIFHRGPHIIRV